MAKQQTYTALIIEPRAFGFNEEASSYNHFQQQNESLKTELAEEAHQEVTELAALLRERGIRVIQVQDDESQNTPSSVFPSSWISFHEDSRITAFPLKASNRKAERRGNILSVIVDNGYPIYDILDISAHENDGKYLHGMESVVIDRHTNTAYCALSSVSDQDVFHEFCSHFGYLPVSFHGVYPSGETNQKVELTNQLLLIAQQYAIVCLDAITDIHEKETVKNSLLAGGKKLIEISTDQMLNFAASGVQMRSEKGVSLLFISETGFNSLSDEQKTALQSYNEVVNVHIPTIERIGGASVSSVIAPVFLPQ